jgi:hypothetical protein
MVTYTHDWEYQVEEFNNGVKLEGEIGFDGGEELFIKFSSGFETTSVQLERLHQLFKDMAFAIRCCGSVDSLEITKKP